MFDVIIRRDNFILIVDGRALEGGGG